VTVAASRARQSRASSLHGVNLADADVLPHTQLESGEVLEERGDAGVPQFGRKLLQVNPVDQDSAGGRAVEAADGV